MNHYLTPVMLVLALLTPISSSAVNQWGVDNPGLLIPETTEQAELRRDGGASAGAIIGIVIAIGGLCHTELSDGCYGENPHINVDSFELVNMNGGPLAVGDWFYIKGSVSGHARNKGHNNRIRYFVKMGGSFENPAHEFSWDVYHQDLGEFTGVCFKYNREIQARSTGTLKIWLRAQIRGWTGHYCAFEEAKNRHSPWTLLQTDVVNPYIWTKSPSPSTVSHQGSGSDSLSTLTATIESRSDAQLTGTLYVDDQEQEFDLADGESETLEVTKADPSWPHNNTSSFKFDPVDLDVTAHLYQGRTWSHSQDAERSVTCNGLFEYSTNIDFANIHIFEPVYEGQTVTFAAVAEDGEVIPPGTVFDWDFGDLATDIGDTVTHEYVSAGPYEVTLTASGPGVPGGPVSESDTVGVRNDPPTIVSISGDSLVLATESLLTVDASATDHDSLALNWEWDFGEGAGYEFWPSATATHAYLQWGTYAVTARVMDPWGALDVMSQTVTVLGSAPVSVPAGDPGGTEGDVLSFDGLASYDTDAGQIEGYRWDFGDGAYAYGDTVSHRFNQDGTFDVTLTVTDNNTNESAASVLVTISDTSPSCVPGSFAATALSSTDMLLRVECDSPNPYQEMNYEWVFSDTTSTVITDGPSVLIDYAHMVWPVTVDVTASDNDGETVVVSGVLDGITGVPPIPVSDSGNRILGVSPNPFNPETKIRFQVGIAGKMRIQVFDARGRLVRNLVDRHFDEGVHEEPWDGRDDSGMVIASSVYYVRLWSDQGANVERIAAIK